MSCSVAADIVLADLFVLGHHAGPFIEIIFLAVYRVPAVISSAAVTQVKLLLFEREPTGLHDFCLFGKIVVFALDLFPSGIFGAVLVKIVLFTVDRDETALQLLLIHGLDNAAAWQCIILDIVKESKNLFLEEFHLVFAL